MNDPSSARIHELQQRVVSLEELFSHEERKVQQLNQVVVDLRRELDQLNSQMAQLQARFRWVLENANNGENLPHEKPPHY